MRTHGLVVAAAALLAFAFALAGCPTPQFPKGPPPEYEDPPPPSWLDGGADRAAPSAPASAPDGGGNT
jgi:hypothetical protein